MTIQDRFYISLLLQTGFRYALANETVPIAMFENSSRPGAAL